eukprot:g47932.t1
MRRNFFSQRVVNLWNILLQKTVEAKVLQVHLAVLVDQVQLASKVQQVLMEFQVPEVYQRLRKLEMCSLEFERMNDDLIESCRQFFLQHLLVRVMCSLSAALSQYVAEMEYSNVEVLSWAKTLLIEVQIDYLSLVCIIEEVLLDKIMKQLANLENLEQKETLVQRVNLEHLEIQVLLVPLVKKVKEVSLVNLGQLVQRAFLAREVLQEKLVHLVPLGLEVLMVNQVDLEMLVSLVKGDLQETQEALVLMVNLDYRVVVMLEFMKKRGLPGKPGLVGPPGEPGKA